MNYANRQPLLTKPKSKRSVLTGVRIPLDLIDPMDALCKLHDVKRSALIVSALRLAMKTPDPALIATALKTYAKKPNAELMTTLLKCYAKEEDNG